MHVMSSKVRRTPGCCHARRSLRSPRKCFGPLLERLFLLDFDDVAEAATLVAAAKPEIPLLGHVLRLAEFVTFNRGPDMLLQKPVPRLPRMSISRAFHRCRGG